MEDLVEHLKSKEKGSKFGVRQVQVIRIGLEEIRHGTGPGSKEYLQLYMKRKYYERDLAYLTMIGRISQSRID